MYVGDDKGNVYMYNLKKVIKQGKRSDQYLRPSRVSEPVNKILIVITHTHWESAVAQW